MKQLTFEQEGLVVSASATPTRGHIVWRGVSDARKPGAFLDDVNKKLAALLRDVEVTVDFRELEYMNSATVAPLLSLVKLLDANGHKVVVIFSNVDWQHTHLKCMMAVARTLRHVTVEGRAAI